MGPNLFGVFGREAGASRGFAYSKSMVEAQVYWSESNLDGFLESPGKVIPNSTMFYPGEPSAAKRRQIIDFLKALN